jgi:hypothetical protein
LVRAELDERTLQTAIEALRDLVLRLEHAVALTPLGERESLITRLVRCDEAVEELQHVCASAPGGEQAMGTSGRLASQG